MGIADEVDSQLAQTMSNYISEAKVDEKAVSALDRSGSFGFAQKDEG
jgi:hypothetical protein